MSEVLLQVRLDGSLDQVSLRTGSEHVIRVSRVPITLLQAQDIHFSHERVIFLPGRDHAEDPAAEPNSGSGEAPPPTMVTGIEVAAAVFQFARYNPKQLLIVGHADATGSDAVNMTVSRDRADNVLHYLTADAETWAAHCQDHYAVDDVQNILTWVAHAMRWPTQPGPIDNTQGELTTGALKAFRHEYNLDFDDSIPVDGPIGIDDWVAFYAVFDHVIETLIGDGTPGDEPGDGPDPTEAVDAEALREKITVLGEGALACGEHWPRSDCEVPGYPEGSDRRVDILFLDEDEARADIVFGDDPPGEALYGLGRVQMDAVALVPRRLGAPDYEVWARISSHWLDRSVADEDYIMRGPKPFGVVVREGATTGEGELRERGLPSGNYEIEIAGSRIPVAAHLENHDPGGFAVPSDLQLPGLAEDDRPLHRSEQAIAAEWVVPDPDEGGSFEEPNPMDEDGVP